MIRNCRCCNSEFEPKYTGTRFCNKNCKDKYQRIMTKGSNVRPTYWNSIVNLPIGSIRIGFEVSESEFQTLKYHGYGFILQDIKMSEITPNELSS